MLPFTEEQFFEVFERYNEAVFPMQVVLILAASASVFLANRPASYSDKAIAAVAGFLWFWTGVVYHLFFFAEINPAAEMFGALFIVEGFLFLYSGLLKKNLSFRFEPNVYGFFGLILIVYALGIYPVIGYLNGRMYPAAPTFGAPCPLVIFTFGLLMWTDKKFALPLLAIPFLWALIGTSAAFNFGVKEDFGLLAAALIGTALIFRRKSAPEKEVLL